MNVALSKREPGFNTRIPRAHIGRRTDNTRDQSLVEHPFSPRGADPQQNLVQTRDCCDH